MTVNRFNNLLWFGALYCATQGALDSWDEAYELSYLSAYGVSVGNIALAQTLGVLPMFIKGILSLPSDLARVRRLFVAAGLILSGSMFLVKVTFNPKTTFWAYCVCLMLRNTGAAISDGAADGLIIDADVEALSGTISAWQGVGRMTGLIISTAVGAVIIGDPWTYAGFSGCLSFLGIWMLCSAPVASIVKEELTPSPLGARLTAAFALAVRTVTCGMDAVVGRVLSDTVAPALSKAGEAAVAGAKKGLEAVGLRGKSDKVGEEAVVVVSPLGGGAGGTPMISPDYVSSSGSGSSSASGGSATAAPTDILPTVGGGEGDRRARLARMGMGTGTGPAAVEPQPGAAPAGGAGGAAIPGVSPGGLDQPEPLRISRPGQGGLRHGVGGGSGSGGEEYHGLAYDRNSPPTSSATPTPSAVSPRGGEDMDGSPSSSGPVDPIAEALGTAEAYRLLFRHIQRRPVAAFVAYMFTAQLATYIASFPVVLWLQEVHKFSVGEVGYLTVVGAFGNAAGSMVAGYGFDATAYKRVALATASLLSGGPYLLFLIAEGKPALYAVWTLISVGYGSLYTVQVSQMRLLADKRVAAAYAGLCMGMLAAAAAVGTYFGGFLTEYVSGGHYEICYTVGAGFCLFGVLLVPYIVSDDREMQELQVRQRADRRRREGKRARRRSSFRRLVAQVKGPHALVDLEIQDAQADALNQSTAARAPRPAGGLKRRAGSSSDLLASSGYHRPGG